MFKQLDLLTSIKLNTFNLCFYAALLPMMGILSDIIGKNKLILFSCFMMLFFSYPLYFLLNNAENIITLEILLLINVSLVATLNASLPAFLCELFPNTVRATSMAIGFGISISIAGGMAPLACLYLPLLTNNINSPAIYIMIFTVIPIYFLFTHLNNPKRFKYLPSNPQKA